ncbi:MAG: T9SS type A sorting domain-containing protein [Balneolaceae bacterium]
MKNLLFMLFFICLSLPAIGQEKYFHDLKGLEDSSGVTHLFYRLYNHLDEEEVIGSENCITWRNDVFHFNTQSETDSLRFESFRQHRCLEFDNPIFAVQDFQFLDNDLSKWFYFSFKRDIYDNHFGRARAYNNSFFDAGGSWINKFDIVRTDTLTFGVYDFWESSIVIILDGDSLSSIQYPYVWLVKANEDEDPELYCPNGEDGNCFYGRSDSVLIYGQNFLSVDHNQKGGMYFQRNDSLFWSDDLGKTMSFRDNEFSWSSMDAFIYGEENSTIISATRFKYSPLDNYFSFHTEPDTIDYYQLLKSTDLGNSWEEVWGDSSKIYLSQILEGDGLFYFGNGNVVYESTNDESFMEFLSVEYPITGLYKKPGSDILYVLTTEELLEVNTETQETTTLKQLPVSSEPEPKEIPKQVTLHQNYPNPFNPSTRIQYATNEASYVELHIYDYLGRRLQTLVNEYQRPGQYVVTFNADGYSSGMYYYQLFVRDIPFKVTKRMTLIK